MMIHDLKDKEGRIFAFEVDNFGLTRKDVVSVVESIVGASVIRRPKRFFSQFREEIFLEFEIEGRRFEAWEPFGDNSRYWIGPEPAEWCEQVSRVRTAFARSEPKSTLLKRRS